MAPQRPRRILLLDSADRPWRPTWRVLKVSELGWRPPRGRRTRGKDGPPTLVDRAGRSSPFRH
eukprot:431013-Pyramimonas_sp.AAC.1